MILVRKGTAIFFLIIFTVSLGAMGVYGYQVLGQFGNDAAAKATSERILFIAIVGVAAVVAAFLAFVGRTLSLYRELDKMIELNKRGDFSPELTMKKLGPIGERITLLYFTLNSLNEKKTLKIGALSALTEFLTENVDIPLFVTDVQGKILYVGRKFLGKVESGRGDYLNHNTDELYPDFPFRDIVLELDKKKAPVEHLHAKNPITLAGIHNRMNELSYIVWIFEKGVLLPDGAEYSEPVREKKGRFRRLIDRR